MAHHGNTPAAWTAVALALLGFVVGGIALVLDPISYPVFWVGAVLVVVGGVAFLVMDKLGFHDSGH